MSWSYIQPLEGPCLWGQRYAIAFAAAGATGTMSRAKEAIITAPVRVHAAVGRERRENAIECFSFDGGRGEKDGDGARAVRVTKTSACINGDKGPTLVRAI